MMSLIKTKSNFWESNRSNLNYRVEIILILETKSFYESRTEPRLLQNKTVKRRGPSTAREETKSMIIPTGTELLTEDLIYTTVNPINREENNDSSSSETQSENGWSSDNLQLSSMSSSPSVELSSMSSSNEEREESMANYAKWFLRDTDKGETIHELFVALTALQSDSNDPTTLKYAMESKERQE